MNAQPTADLHVQQLLSLLRRRIRMIATIGLAGATLAGLIGFIIPPRYTGKAQLVIDDRSHNASAQAAMGSGFTNAADEVALETHVAMLTSHRHLQRVLDSFRAELNLPTEEPAPKELWSILKDVFQPEASAAQASDDAADPAVADLPDGVSPEATALDENILIRNMNVFRERRSRVIAVTFTSKNAEFAAQVANRSVSLYLNDLIEREKARNEKALAKIEDRIPQLREEVEKAHMAALLYQIEHGLSSDGKFDAVDPNFVELNRQLNLAKSDLADRQARLTYLRELQRGKTDLPALLKALDDPILSELYRSEIKPLLLRVAEGERSAVRPSEDLAELQRKISQQIERKLTEIESDTQVVSARVRSLQQSVTSLQKASTDAREPETRLRELQFEAKLKSQLYESLLARQQEMREKWDTQTEARLLSMASVPDEPSSPDPILFVFPALILSLIPAGLLAILKERSDQSLRSEQDVHTTLGIDCLGVMPKLPRIRKLRSHQYLLQRPLAPYSEGIRSTVASALQLTKPNSAPKIFLVTSSIPCEGKTALAIAFSTYAALLHRRVLLIDANFRHPSVSKELGEDTESGTLSALQGRPVVELINHNTELGIDVLPQSGNIADPAVVLTQDDILKLLDQLRENYDCVVIDGAPLLGTMGAQLLVPYVDRIIFAVKWGSTRRQIAQSAIGVLRNILPGNRNLRDQVGAVVTQVDLKQHTRYGFGDQAEMLFRYNSRKHAWFARKPSPFS